MTATANRPGERLALAGLGLSILLASFGMSAANVALPTLAEAFGASFQATQWVVLAYLLATTAAVVAAGRLGDRTGRRRLLVAGVALFAAASVACGVAPSLETLVAARAAQGLGAAVMLALAMALVGDAVPRARTGRAMGLLGTTSAVGTALGPSLGGLLIAGLGWRAIFLATVPPAVVAGVLVRRNLPADEPGTGSEPSPGQLRLAWRLRGGLVPSALVATVLMTTLVVGPFHLTGALGLDAAAVGLVMAAGPLVAALAAVPAGRLTERAGPRRAALAGLAGVGAGTTGLGLLPASLGVPGYVLPLVVMTAGYATFQTANNTGVVTRVGSGDRGAASGMLNLSRNLGLIAGASVMGALFSLAAGGDAADASPGAVAAGMQVTFLVAAALILAAVAIMSLRWPRRMRRPWRPRAGRSASPARTG